MNSYKSLLAFLLFLSALGGCGVDEFNCAQEKTVAPPIIEDAQLGLDAADIGLEVGTTPCEKFYLSDVGGVRLIGSPSIYKTLIVPYTDDLQELNYRFNAAKIDKALETIVRGRADIAMLTIPFNEATVKTVSESMGQAYDISNFTTFPLGYLKVGVIVNADNPLAKGETIDNDSLASILTGQSDLWTDIGVGRQSNIQIATDTLNGGVSRAVSTYLMENKPFPKNTRVVSDATQINNFVQHSPNSLGLTYTNLVDNTVIPIKVKGFNIYVPMILVEYGRPSASDVKLIAKLQELARDNPNILQTLPDCAKGAPMPISSPLTDITVHNKNLSFKNKQPCTDCESQTKIKRRKKQTKQT